MYNKKLPPIEKVYEAWSAIADGRVNIISDTRAEVRSSDGTKSYTIIYDPSTDTYYSDDNATFWQGYAGYPVLAVMMLSGRLPFDKEYADIWAGINWKAINDSHKRNYAAAVAEVERERNIDPEVAADHAKAVMEALAASTATAKRLTKKQK